MRERFEERTKRFLDSKKRTIGIDKAYLDKQVEEKNQQCIREKERLTDEGETIMDGNIFLNFMMR